jgi:hypothetical protein
LIDTATFHNQKNSWKGYSVANVGSAKISVTKPAKATSMFFMAWTKTTGAGGGTGNFWMVGAGTTLWSSSYTVTWPWGARGGIVTGLTVGTNYSLYFMEECTAVGGSANLWVDEALICPLTITINGLFNGQKARFLKNGAIIATSPASAGNTLTYTGTAAELLNLPFDAVEITDVDGVTVLQRFSFTGAFSDGVIGGDVFQAQVTSGTIRNPPPINPLHDGLSRIMVLTSKRLYTRILGYDLSQPAAGSLGTFRIFIEDETGREKDNLSKGEVCWIFGDLGFEHDIQMVGIIDTPTVHQFPGGVQALELAGRSYGSYAAEHAFSSRVDHQFQNPYYIMTNSTNGVATLVPEMEIGPYVFSPPNNLTYVTYLPGRDAYDVTQEVADMSSKPEQRWNAYDCDGQDQGETKPNLHFEPVSRGISLLPILFGKGFRVQEPEDSRQILTKAIVHYADSVAYDATDLVTIDSCFKLKFNIPAPADYSLYVDLTNVADYVIQAGDFLEYDVYYTHPQVLGGMDLYNSTAAQYLRNIAALDQWGLDAGPAGAGKAANRLGGSGRWGHRKIPLPISWVGGSITKFLPYADPNEVEFRGGSCLLDGSGDYLSIPDSTDWAFGTGDFTIDFWVRFNSVASTAQIWHQNVDSTHYIGLEHTVAAGPIHSWYFYVVNGGATVNFKRTATTHVTGTWYHVALVRSGTDWYFFEDGVQVGATLTGEADSVIDLASVAYIGSWAGTASYLNGWLDEFRVSKGVARWVSNFTPPTAPYAADPSTVLLLHMDGPNGSTIFTDSTFRNIVTANGDAKIDTTWSAFQSMPFIRGDFNIAFRNIRITDGQAAVRKVIYDGETSTLTTATDSSVNATFTSIVGGDDPRFGIISQLFERIWMTQSQAKDFGKLACTQLGDPITFIQGDLPPDGRWKQGQLVEVWDEDPVGKGRLIGVRHREMGGIGQTHLTLLLEEEVF